MNPFRALLLASAAVAGLTVPAFADDWVATKLRGLAFVHNDGAWQPLERGDAVTDLDVVRTLPSGRAEFTRGTEVISLAGDSQIRIVDAAGKFTTVHQAYGKVTVDADKENVQHFAVRTPYIAAVVKGTVFTVVVRNGRAEVSVDEGRVQVQEPLHQLSVDVHPGQKATASDTELLSVRGRGAIEQLRDASGAPIAAAALAVMQENLIERNRGSGNGNAGTGSQGNAGVATANAAAAAGAASAGNVGGNANKGGGGNAGGNSNGNSNGKGKGGG